MNLGSKTGWIFSALLLFVAAVWLHFQALDMRPMHPDETVNAFRFADFLERGYYDYDPGEFHGPMLHYWTYPFATLFGQRDFKTLNEVSLRCATAILGILLCGVPFLFLGYLSRRAIFFSAVLLAFSPGLVYYSRYYIHEMLFALFAGAFIACLWRYFAEEKLRWAILTGLFAGLMHATKETCVLVYAAAAVAIVFSHITDQRKFIRNTKKRVACKIAMLVVAAGISALLYSGFGHDLKGVKESYSTFFISTARALHTPVHTYPWYYYLDLFTWLEFFEKQPWNEDILVVLSALAVVMLFCTRKISLPCSTEMLRFTTCMTLSLYAIYSIIPYKTPWNGVVILYAMALPSGIMIAWLWQQRSRWLRLVLILVCVVNPMVQAWWLNFKIPADPANPYVYAHTGPEIFQMDSRIQSMIQAVGNRPDFGIYVIDDTGYYWPWPWYLRQSDKVGYWNEIDRSMLSATIILAPLRMEERILNALYEWPPSGQKSLYMPVFDKPLPLRPGVLWQGYIRKDDYDKWLQQRVSDVNKSPVTEPSTMNHDMSPLSDKPIRFSEQAMATVFEIYISSSETKNAAAAARAAFAELAGLEAELSRYVPNSDVSRINNLQPSQETVVSPDTMDCLLTAQKIHQLTGGAFDPTLGKVAEQQKQTTSASHAPVHHLGMDNLELDPENLTVRVKQGHADLDLGGIGKGCALDKMAKILRQWNISRAMLNAGASTILAMDPPANQAGWPVVIRHPKDPDQIIEKPILANQALSASSIVRKPHIINPATGKPVTDRLACWVFAADGASGDALSTAVMIMPEEKIRQLLHEKNASKVIICTPDAQIAVLKD
ncbi:MAG: flippase activity-associated protein Agl23 [Anaerohalosphaeraceae bacterium]